MSDTLPVDELKAAARRYVEQSKASGTVLSPEITDRSPGVVLKRAKDLAAELRRAS